MAKVQLTVKVQDRLGVINPNIYGSFAEHLGRCIYGGLWVGPESKIPNVDGLRLEAVEALRELQLPVLRWPGGCFADNYHWQWGIGPREQRPPRHNLWWKQPEPNAFGTDEFMHLCELVGCRPYICLNVGSGSVEEALGWVEYCNSSQETYYTRLRRDNGREQPYGVRYWGVGNENWGCGGHMTPEQYAAEYRKYATYLRAMDDTVAGGLFLVACGYHDTWNRRLLAALQDVLSLVDGLSLHLYVGAYSKSATEFSDGEHYRLMGDVLDMEAAVRRTKLLLQEFAPQRPPAIVVDEWGTWYGEATVPAGLYQQNALRDALFTACALNMFNRHCDAVAMTNMAQTVNVLQSVLLTRGPQLIRTPTYWVYWMYRPHMGASAVRCQLEPQETVTDSQGRAVPCLSASASLSSEARQLFVTVANIHLSETAEVTVQAEGAKLGGRAKGQLLTAADVRAHNDFDAPDRVRPQEISFSARRQLTLALPPAAVLAISVPLAEA
jgi:alpha-N-arabinofuranosidase